MAEYTLEQIRGIIRFRGDYQNVRKFPNTSVDQEAQIAFGKFYQLVAEANQGWWDTQDTVTTTANIAYVAPPTNTWQVKGVDLLDGDYRELRQVSHTERNRFGNTTAMPEMYFLSARGIELMATPNAVYTLRVLYTPRAPLLATSQPREWYNGWEEYVIESVLAVLDKREGNPRAAEHFASVDRIEKSVRTGAGERRQQEPEYLRLREFDSTDPYDDWTP